MSFSLEKCGRMIARKGKVIKTNGLELPAGHIAEIQTSYKYLGIPPLHGNHDEEARRTATSKYHQRVRQVLKIQLNVQNKIQAINTYLPVIRYPAGIVSWTKEEMEAADARRLPPQVQCPETVHQPKRGWTGPGERPSHHTG